MNKNTIKYNYAMDNVIGADRIEWCGHKTVAKPVCVGSGFVVLDVIYGDTSKTPMFFAGGSCCNVLTILSYLGWNSFPLARLGEDPEGDKIIDDMEMWGVQSRFVVRDHNIHSPRIIEHVHNDNTPHHSFHLKCEHGYRLPRRRPMLLKHLQSIQNTLPKPNIFYFDRVDHATLEAAAMFNEKGSVIVFEPPKIHDNANFTHCLELADVVKYSRSSSSRVGHLKTAVSLEIQTRGANGLAYRAGFLGNESWIEMEAIPTPRLVDAAGSGDWLTAGLIHTIWFNGTKIASSEKELQDSLRFGQALAALNCGFVGARGIMYSLDRGQILSAADCLASGSKPVSVNETVAPT